MTEMADDRSIEIVTGQTLSPNDEPSPQPPTDEVDLIVNLTDNLVKMTDAYRSVSESGDSLPPSTSRMDSSSLESKNQEEKEEMQRTIDSLRSELSSALDRPDGSLCKTDKEVDDLKKKVSSLELELKYANDDLEDEKKRHEKLVSRLRRDLDNQRKKKEEAEREAREEMEKLEEEFEEERKVEKNEKKDLKEKIRRLEEQVKSLQAKPAGDEEEATIGRKDVERLEQEKSEVLEKLEKEKTNKEQLLARIKSLEAEREQQAKESIRLEDDATLQSLTRKHEAEMSRLQEQVDELERQVKDERSSKEEVTAARMEQEGQVAELTESLRKERSLKERIMAQSKKLIEERNALQRCLESPADFNDPATPADGGAVAMTNGQLEAFRRVKEVLEADSAAADAQHLLCLLRRDFDELLDLLNLQTQELALQRRRVRRLQEGADSGMSAEKVRKDAEEAIAVLVGVTCNLQEQLEGMTSPGRADMFVKPVPRYNGSERFVGSRKPQLF